jgi:hypothetical protein
MALMVACGLLVIVAVALMFRWRGDRLAVPPSWLDGAENHRSVGHLILVYVWLVLVGAIAGLLAGALVIGPGARLAMRLLAATSPDARGMITEAQEVVGDISVDGTLALMIFGGILAGLGGGIVYALLHRALPHGVPGGLVFGLVLLVTVATRLDPLRSSNPDFDIVGLGWLAVTVFGVVILLGAGFGAAAAGWLSRVLPYPGPKALAYGLPLALLMIAIWPLAVIVLAAGALFVALNRLAQPVDLARRGIVALRIALAVLMLVLLPDSIGALIAIV